MTTENPEYNYRGQLNNYVFNSVVEGEKREKTLLEYLCRKNIILNKTSKYKHYDFTFSKNKHILLEFKSINYSINTFENVFIGFDKLLFYFYKQYKNPDVVFILIYGFYEKIDGDLKIKYRYDVINVKVYLFEYSKRLLQNKKHINIPTNTLKPLKHLITALRETSLNNTTNDFLKHLEILENPES